MTNQPQYASAPPPQRPAPKNGLGTAGFVLGLIGLVFSPIPIVGIIAWPLVILGVIFSAVGFARARNGKATNKGLSLAGLVVSIVGLVICIIWTVAFGSAMNDAAEDANTPVSITYEVTGDAENVTISYSTFGESMRSSQASADSLPWTKTVETTGFVKGGTLSVSTGADGGTVKCKVTVGDEKPVTGTASGQFATANCSGF